MDTSCMDIFEHYHRILLGYEPLRCIRIQMCFGDSAINILRHDSSSALYRILLVLIISEYIRPAGRTGTILKPPPVLLDIFWSQSASIDLITPLVAVASVKTGYSLPAGDANCLCQQRAAHAPALLFPQPHSTSMASSFPSADSGSGPIEEDVVTPRGCHPPPPTEQHRPLSGSQPSDEEEAPPSQTTASDVDVLASVVGPYAPTPALACPSRLIHGGQEWLPVQDGGNAWTKEPKADHFFDTLHGSGEDQRGHFVVRCRDCALEGVTTTYMLRRGQSSNAWKHFGMVAASRVSSALQRRRHAAVATYRTDANHAPKAGGSGAGGPMSAYLTVPRDRVMSAEQARPHHVRLVLMLVMTLSPFALAGNAYLHEFVRGLGVPYTTPSPAGVRDVLLDVYLFITDRLRREVRQLQSRYCDNTLSPPHPVGGRASQTVSPGSPVGEYPPRKETPKSTHARRRPGEGAPSDKHELCDRKFTGPRRRPQGDTHASPSYPVRSPRTLGIPSSDIIKGPSENPPQIRSKDSRKTLLRHPERTLGKPSSQGPRGP